SFGIDDGAFLDLKVIHIGIFLCARDGKHIDVGKIAVNNKRLCLKSFECIKLFLKPLCTLEFKILSSGVHLLIEVAINQVEVSFQNVSCLFNFVAIGLFFNQSLAWAFAIAEVILKATLELLLFNIRFT